MNKNKYPQSGHDARKMSKAAVAAFSVVTVALLAGIEATNGQSNSAESNRPGVETPPPPLNASLGESCPGAVELIAASITSGQTVNFYPNRVTLRTDDREIVVNDPIFTLVKVGDQTDQCLVWYNTKQPNTSANSTATLISDMSSTIYTGNQIKPNQLVQASLINGQLGGGNIGHVDSTLSLSPKP